jgi:H/ACA ribonucleoprotein complex subunit 2
MKNFEMGKEATDEISYEDKANKVTAISSPLAPKKLGKKILKVIKKGTSTLLMQATKAKSIKRGVKEVVKGLRKGAKG